jgi:hypothetical protein
MTRSMLGAAGLALLVAFCETLPAAAQSSPFDPRQQVVPLTRQDLASTWRASSVLGRPMRIGEGEETGLVRNILIGEDGRVRALIVEANAGDDDAFVIRIPWPQVTLDFENGVTADVPDATRPEYNLFPHDTKDKARPPDEFAITALIGDYARLQAGQGYGHVSDAFLTGDGRLRAVLIVRDRQSGGGAVAFGFPSNPSEHWRPYEPYYGLPYVTLEQANTAAVRIRARDNDASR